jgi:hypothetical protein
LMCKYIAHFARGLFSGMLIVEENGIHHDH